MTHFFANLEAQAADGLLALMLDFRADPRPDKIDLGLGVYRDEDGQTPVMAAVKAAERILIEEQKTKVYLGVDGDADFVRRLAVLPFGADRIADPRLAGMQTPGGTGALRLAAEMFAAAQPGSRMWIGDPTWPNHVPIFRAAGVDIVHHRLLDRATNRLDLVGMLADLRTATPGDGVLLHGCCHNPTGFDFTADQWDRIADVVIERRLLPIIDLAYQGLGRGIEDDARGTRRLFDRAEALIVAYSCDKNFGLYRERTGALWVRTPTVETLAGAQSAMRNPARAAWSMPPDHGAAVVRVILSSDELTDMWRAELDAMRVRIATLRAALAASHPRLAPLNDQTGMFAMLPIEQDIARSMRRDRAIYITDDGRVNIAGLNARSLPIVTQALENVLER